MSAMAQENKVVNLQLETRIDYQHEFLDGNTVKSNSGFRGKYLNVMLSGDIGKHWSYSYRQRLNKAHANQSFFDATDWIHLTYTLNKHWSFNAGKQVVGIGGYEYDRAPIDLYFCSEYWNNIACYQFGVSTTYTTRKGHDRFMAQVCESPFRHKSRNLYAYNLMWFGKHGCYNSIWSLNAMQAAPGRVVYYLALGNEFRFGDAKVQLDFMNRVGNDHCPLFKDFSVMGEFSYLVAKKVNLFARMSYDVNKTNSAADLCVLPGTDITRLGAGIEYYPLKQSSHDLRFHLFGCHTFGRNVNPDGVLQDNQNFIGAGVKFRMDVISLTKKIFK